MSVGLMSLFGALILFGAPSGAIGEGRCSDLQTVARGLANKHRFQLTFCANTGPRKPIFTANEPTFAANSLQTVS